MQLVIADAGPINYFAPDQHIDILPALFERVILPCPVKDELRDTEAPARGWPVLHRGARFSKPAPPKQSPTLGRGETAAITLAIELDAV